jgi:hypothetical protein
VQSFVCESCIEYWSALPCVGYGANVMHDGDWIVVPVVLSTFTRFGAIHVLLNF